MQPSQFILVRHGETQWNLEGKRQGHLDSPLTPKGIAQARALAQRLANENFGTLFSSDLGRAFETAQIIAGTTGHTITVDPRLRERNLGIFQGLRTEEIVSVYPEEYRLNQTGNPDYVIPNGESLRQQLERNVRCFDDLAERHRGESLVVVTHGGVLSAFLRYTVAIPLEARRRFEFLNASINVFHHRGDRWILRTWGDISHLNSEDRSLALG